MKRPVRLLAKGSRGGTIQGEDVTLLGHSKRVLKAADLLVDMLARDIRRTTAVSGTEMEAWGEAVKFGSWLHDLGKANDHFQAMIRHASFRQGVRHEALTLVIANILRRWLSPFFDRFPRWVKAGALFACAGHHLKFPDPFGDQRPHTEVVLLLGHPDFSSLLEMGATRFGLGTPESLRDETLSLRRRGEVKNTLRAMRRDLDADCCGKEKLLIACVKTAVMAADLAGSALPGRIEDPKTWLKKRLGRTLDKSQLGEVVKRRLGANKPLEFQRRVGRCRRRTTLLEAGCGSGKTAAAYLWASDKARDRRLFFCYPTTTTASEGFAGYLYDPDFEALLVHGRSRVDYELLDNMPEPGHEENELRSAGLEALDTWGAPAVVCTAHTVLGLLENVRRGLYAWPSLVRSAFVFDEVHAFSGRLFSYLLRFLNAFPGAPALLMTATLPPARKRALEEISRGRGGLDIIHGPRKREEATRYRLRNSSSEEAWLQAKACLAGGGKVLWVCNTVARCMGMVECALSEALPVQPFHSRYRYKDRLRRQRALVDGFGPNKPAMLAVTTQVAEMSLDLSADLLVSEHAPVPSMIQRMGRLNRFNEEPAAPADALLVEPENILPYDKESMTGVKEWIDRLVGTGAHSQADLAEAFIDVFPESEALVEPARYCEWLDGLWQSRKDQRAIEEAGFAVEVIMEEDAGSDSPIKSAIPMPIPKNVPDWKGWRREGRYLTAPRGTILYDEFKGAQWLQRRS